MSDYDRLALKLEALEFSGAPVGVLIDDARLARILGVRQRKVFKCTDVGDDGELISLEDLYTDEGPYRTLAIGVDKDKDLTRAVIAWALRVLPMGGQLMLTGEKRLGVQSFEKYLNERMEGVAKIPVKDIGRLSLWTKNQDFIENEKQNISVNNLWSENKIDAPWISFTLHALPGVFSAAALDKGTEQLLEVLELPNDGRMLDLACGGGVIGAWTKIKESKIDVVLADNDANAVASAKKTFAANKIDAQGFFCANGTEGVMGLFDIITLNPPFHHGQTVDYRIAERLIAEAHAALMPRGQLWIVANKFCPYEKTLGKLFGKFEQVREAAGFKVLKAIKA